MNRLPLPGFRHARPSAALQCKRLAHSAGLQIALSLGRWGLYGGSELAAVCGFFRVARDNSAVQRRTSPLHSCYVD